MILTKRITKRILLCCFLFTILLSSCKKDAQVNKQDNNSVQQANSLTKVYVTTNTNSDNRMSENQNNGLFGTPLTGEPTIKVPTVYSYSITTGCSSNNIDLTDISFPNIGLPLNNFPTPGLIPLTPPVPTVRLNGISFTPTYLGGGSTATGYHYQLKNIPLSSIGVSDFCSSSSVTISFYLGILFEGSKNLPINEGVSCGSGSYQCIASSPASGKLSFFLPFLACGCANMYPPVYTFGYRLKGTANWTTVPLSYPAYFTPYPVSGLTPGVYEVQGQNTCTATTSAPAVPASTATVTVQ